MSSEKKTMRDVFIEQICNRMSVNDSLFFISADFGSPKLDKLRENFKDRFINVGIAEQNLINVSTGLALEGFTVYAYAIAPFLVMRAYEQIRNNLSLLSKTHEVNVNLIGVGAGLSYDVSGPTHHCLEDISIMRTLPNIDFFSPSDWVLAEKFVDYSIAQKKPKYLRFDGKPLPNIYVNKDAIKMQNGFFELSKGEGVCLVSTGYMTHTALKAVSSLKREGVRIGLVDIFFMKNLDEALFLKAIKKYRHIVTIEEGFINKGGLDSMVSSIVVNRKADIILERMGFDDAYVFDIGTRDYLHKINRLDEAAIVNNVKNIIGISDEKQN
jgi:transketolase